MKSLGYEAIKSAEHGDVLKQVLEQMKNKAASEQAAQLAEQIGAKITKPDTGFGRVLIKK